jgi:hypothetical protein
MKSQLIPPPELAPPSVMHLPMSKRIGMWIDLVNMGEAFLRAGLRRKIGPDGDINAAFRDWNSRQMEERESRQIQFLTNLSRCERAGGH